MHTNLMLIDSDGAEVLVAVSFEPVMVDDVMSLKVNAEVVCVMELAEA